MMFYKCIEYALYSGLYKLLLKAKTPAADAA
jgi:hypothetical protein